jgi:hypothetical protein
MAEPEPEQGSAKRRRLMVWLIVFAVLSIVSYTQLTFFVVQPIGALPEGRTLLLRRTGRLKFIDSADAVCERETGGVNLLCRGAILGAVAREGNVLARLPYSSTLYSISTGGKEYDR